MHVRASGLLALAVGVLLVLGLSTVAMGQATTGTISGVVSDKSGAVISSATVSLRNLDTNITRTFTTREDGRFQFPALPVGPYELKTTAAGFGTYVRGPIVLLLSQEAIVNPVLSPAAASEVVTVTEDAPLLNTTTSEVGVRFDSSRLSGLPTNVGGALRDVFSYAVSAPGVSQLNSGNSDFANGVNFSVNGMRVRSNNFMLDGQDSNDPSVTGRQQQWNNPDAIQEFRLITNQFAPEFGRAAGSVVSVVSKGGTNNFHGSGFWYYNGTPLNARSNLDKAAQVGTGITKQPLRIENQYGGTLGGPILKNKTFFFISAQRWTNAQMGSGATINGAPTADGRAALQANGGSLPQVQALLNHLPAAQTAATNLVFYCFNGTSAPTVTGTGLGKTASCSSGTLVTVPVGSITGQNRNIFNNWQWSARVDHEINGRNRFMARYMMNDSQSAGAGQATPPGLANISPTRTQSAIAGVTTNLTPLLLNEFRIAWSKFRSSTDPEDPVALEIPSIEIADLGLSGFNAAGSRTAIGYGVNLPQSRKQNIYQLLNDTTWTKSTHTLKWGVEIDMHPLVSDFNPNVRGQLRYSTLHNYVADFADVTAQLNRPLPGGQLIMHYKWWDEFMYFQDTWKVRSNLSLNYGLRYELPGNAIDSLYPVNDNIVAAAGNNPLFRYNSRPPSDTNNLQPRFGFNWNPRTSDTGVLGFLTGGDKLVVRGGYARTNDYAFLNMALNITSAFPFQAAFSFPSTPGSYARLQSLIANPVVSLGTGAACNTPAGVGTAPCLNQTIVAKDFRTPYADQYTFEVQREMGANNVFRLGWVATKGTALYQSREGNPTTRCFPVPSAGCPRVDPFRGVVRVRSNTGSSIYHSMQASIDHRFSSGLSAGAHYTWSAFIDDASEVFNPSGNAEVATFQDPFSKVGERARSTYDRPHRLTGNVIWELPWYRTQPGPVGHVLGGWQVGALMTFQSGSPFTVLNGADPGRVLLGSLVGNAVRPNLNHTPGALYGKTLDEILAMGGASLWTPLPSNGSIPTGNSPRNYLRGDGLISVDTNIAKNIKVRENQQLQFRMDMYNMPNHRNFGIPNSFVNSGSAFLNEKSTDGGNRRIFMSLRYSF